MKKMLQVFIGISCVVVIVLANLDETCNDLKGKGITAFEAEKVSELKKKITR